MATGGAQPRHLRVFVSPAYGSSSKARSCTHDSGCRGIISTPGATCRFTIVASAMGRRGSGS